MLANVLDCPFTNSIPRCNVLSPAPSATLLTFQDPSDGPSFLSQGQGEGKASSPSQQGHSFCLLDPPPSHGLQAPVPSVISFFPRFVSCFPLASPSTCKRAPGSCSISKYPPFSLLLPASPPAPSSDVPFPTESLRLPLNCWPSGHAPSLKQLFLRLLLTAGPIGGLFSIPRIFFSPFCSSPFYLCDFSGP